MALTILTAGLAACGLLLLLGTVLTVMRAEAATS